MASWYIIHTMSSLNQIYHGTSIAPDIFFELHAGKVRLFFCDGAIRTVMVDDSEIVRRIYVAVRDDIWNTIGYSLSNLAIDSTGSSFHLEFDCRHKKGRAIRTSSGSLKIELLPYGIARLDEMRS